MKRCARCEQTKPLDDFPSNKAQRDGKQVYCRPCQQAYSAAYRSSNRDKALAYARAYYRENRERLSEYQANYRANLTPEQIEVKREYTRAWRQTHPEWVKALNYASNKVRWALKTGRLVRATSCEWCGKSGCKIAGAHWDYSRPLDVVWLCYPCHSQWDAAEPKLPRTIAS